MNALNIGSTDPFQWSKYMYHQEQMQTKMRCDGLLNPPAPVPVTGLQLSVIRIIPFFILLQVSVRLTGE